MKHEPLPDLSSEMIITTSRSSGPGGQNVNKLETKVEIKLDVRNSSLLTPDQKERILLKLGNKLIQSSVLAVSSQEGRTQGKNKENAVKKLYKILEEALEEEKERVPTRPTEESKEIRMKVKRKLSENKKFRGNLKGKVED